MATNEGRRPVPRAIIEVRNLRKEYPVEDETVGGVIVPSKAEYNVLLDILKQKGAETDIEDRKMFAERAFGVSSHYDTAIHAWFAK